MGTKMVKASVCAAVALGLGVVGAGSVVHAGVVITSTVTTQYYIGGNKTSDVGSFVDPYLPGTSGTGTDVTNLTQAAVTVPGGIGFGTGSSNTDAAFAQATNGASSQIGTGGAVFDDSANAFTSAAFGVSSGSPSATASVDESAQTFFTRTITLSTDANSYSVGFEVIPTISSSQTASQGTNIINGSYVADVTFPTSGGGSATANFYATSTPGGTILQLAPNSTYTVTEVLSASSGINASVPLPVSPAYTPSSNVNAGLETVFDVLPEPATLPVAGFGLAALAGVAVRKRRRSTM